MVAGPFRDMFPMTCRVSSRHTLKALPDTQDSSYPSSLFASNRTHLAHVISRPFRANRFFGCFLGLEPWAESYSPCGLRGKKNIPNGLIFVPFTADPPI